MNGHTIFASLILSLIAPALSIFAEDNDAFWKSVYNDNHVLQIEMKVSRESWETMQPKRGNNTRGQGRLDSANEFDYAKAEITIDGEQFSDAGLRFKGNSSYRSSRASLKKPFKIDTNRFIKGQKLHGRTKLNLSNAFLDPAYMKEKLAYGVYRAAGLPTPQTGWANVVLSVEGIADKKPLGIYVVIEQLDERYLKENLQGDSQQSILTKPESLDDWEYLGQELDAYQQYNIKIGKTNTPTIQRFIEIMELIEKSSDQEFADKIQDYVDLENIAGYLAATSLLANIDSYIGMPHNYYLLLNHPQDKLKLLPWDVNEAFGTFTLFGPSEQLIKWEINRPWVARRKLLERLFETEQFPKLYRVALTNLMEKAFTEKQMFAQIDEYKNALTPVLQKLGSDALEPFAMGIEGDARGRNLAVGRRTLAIKPFITQRIESVEAQLEGVEKGVSLSRRR
ncbi:MAG: CotH kinase family protein [Mariniblastus sp.]|nr:CotH kinase family protein [Mariniblastus sp.]